MKPSRHEIEKMHDYIAGSSIASAIHVAAKLGISDHLAKKSLTIGQLATLLEVNSHSLNRLMRALAGIGVFLEENEGSYTLTNMGSLLCSNAPHSMKNLILIWGADWHSDLWMGLEYSVKHNKPYFSECFGMEFFEFIQKRPEAVKQFHAAMASLSSLSDCTIAERLELSLIKKVADIGGGTGGLLMAILQKWSHLNGLLYDIPSAIDKAKGLFQEQDLSHRCSLISGDFFTHIPSNVDAYIIKHVLHGLDEKQSIDLLKRVKSSAEKPAKIYIVEMVMPEANVIASLMI